MKYKIGKYVFLIASPICFYLFWKESFPYNYFYLLLTIWFLYMFINEQAELERVAAKTENLVLVVLNIVVGVVPIISSALVFFVHEKSVTWLFTFMIMICINLLIKILFQRENRSKLVEAQKSDLKVKASESSDMDILLQTIIGFAFNLIVAMIIIYYFLSPEIYMQPLFDSKVLFFGVIGATIPLLMVFLGVKIRKIDFPVNSNTKGVIQLLKKPWGPIVVSIGSGISEELLFRGALFGLLTLYFYPFVSILVISILFMMIHLPQYKNSHFLNLVIFVLSIVFTVIYVQSETIWAPILAHALYNFIICLWINSGFLPLSTSDEMKSEVNV